ncbi:right-handed parallel beta-helix repeat-containing protein [Pseudonocardia kunmingensis]|uniref:Parallel beta helix pectate lyase-like protein n=1 Tax=Pseudonocardia kunmingensis TaxID=630975 RepID=A0A543DLM7_9PSEU|nr:right-handed parallel beta-helix repeat-containing protein [Pseudonocardia kunmingensis]TQM10228.1 parallel beta helix pectate lyase-like protein [Pseudonocardia kunmingensis]
MTAPRTGSRRLARIIAASVALSAVALPVMPAAALAAPAGTAAAAAPAQETQPPGDSGGSGDTGGSDTPPDNGGDDGGSGGDGNSGGSNGGGASNPEPTRRPAPQSPRPDPEAEARKKAEEQAAKDEAKRQREAEKAAEQAAKAAREAAEDRAEAARKAAREAAERAEQAAKARESWDSRGRPHQMITVREDRVEVVDEGRLETLVPRRGGTMSLQALDDMVPRDWLTMDGGSATLSATLVLTPGTAMEIGPDVQTLRLTGGPEIPDASAIYTGGGRLNLQGVTISSIDPATQQPLPFEAVGRPFIEVTGGGELNATDTTITDMGTPEHGEESAEPGLGFNPGSTGSLVRTTLQRNNVGVELSESRNVKIDGLTVSESEGEGLVLNGDQGTTLAGIRAEGNGGNGVYVSGESNAPITGISTAGNGLYGVVVTGRPGAQVTGITTEGDQAGGLRLNQAVDVTVSDFTANDQPIGVFTHVGSTGIVLDGLKMTGGRRGVVVEKSTTNLDLRNSTIEGSRVSAVNIGGKDIRVNGVQLADARAAVRLERGSGHIDLTGVTIDGGRDGIVASAGAEEVVINELTANHVQEDAIRTESPGMQINGGTITGGTTGIDVAAAATISAITINGSSEGIHSRSPELVRAENIAIDAIDLGLNVGLGSPFVLANSSVHALEAFRGSFQQEGVNNFSLPPLNLLGAIGVPLILLAIVLEQVHSFRQRKVGGNKRRVPPAIPVGAG